MHNKKENQMRKIADLSGDVAKSKQFLPFLQRAGKMQAVVEFVASASRFRVYIPKETCVITFLLSGVSCPRGERVMPGGQVVEAEPFGTEALNFVKEMVLQREVEIEVESMDKGGNFIGWCFFGAVNISVSLVEEGFAGSYLMGGERGGSYANIIMTAEENAKRRKVRRWANYVPEEDVAAEVKAKEEEENEEERKVNYQSVVVTEVSSDAKFYAQHVDEGPKLEQLMKQIREEFSSNPPLAGAYQPRKGKFNFLFWTKKISICNNDSEKTYYFFAKISPGCTFLDSLSFAFILPFEIPVSIRFILLIPGRLYF